MKEFLMEINYYSYMILSQLSASYMITSFVCSLSSTLIDILL